MEKTIDKKIAVLNGDKKTLQNPISQSFSIDDFISPNPPSIIAEKGLGRKTKHKPDQIIAKIARIELNLEKL